LVFAHDGYVGDVEVGGVEEIELALHVEIEEALDGAVGGDYTAGDGGVLRLVLDFLEVFAFVTGGSDGERKPDAFGGIFGAGMQDGVGDLGGFHGLELLAIFFVEIEREADAVEADFEALIGVVAEGYLYGEDTGGEGRFFGELFFVFCGIHPRARGDGEAFVRFEGRSLQRGGGLIGGL